MRPITLWDPSLTSQSVNDDAGIDITTSVVRPPPSPTLPRRLWESQSLSHVPDLAYYCAISLAEHPEQVHGALRLTYRRSANGCDIVHGLIPAFGKPGFSWFDVDPRLWAVLVQLYDGLPSAFRNFDIALSDVCLPLLLQIPSTPDFTLITVLDLRACKHLTDKTILELKALHNLNAFDASNTSLTSYGIYLFGKCLTYNAEEGGRGPWQLRLLRLQNCRKLDKACLSHLSSFPYLSFIDLRGTLCRKGDECAEFSPGASPRFFHPTPIATATRLYFASYDSRTKPFMLNVTDIPRYQADPVQLNSAVGFYGAGPQTTGLEQGHRIASTDTSISKEFLMLYRPPPTPSSLKLEPEPKIHSQKRASKVRLHYSGSSTISAEGWAKKLQRLRSHPSHSHPNTEVYSQSFRLNNRTRRADGIDGVRGETREGEVQEEGT